MQFKVSASSPCFYFQLHWCYEKKKLVYFQTFLPCLCFGLVVVVVLVTVARWILWRHFWYCQSDYYIILISCYGRLRYINRLTLSVCAHIVSCMCMYSHATSCVPLCVFVCVCVLSHSIVYLCMYSYTFLLLKIYICVF